MTLTEFIAGWIRFKAVFYLCRMFLRRETSATLKLAIKEREQSDMRGKYLS